MSTLTNAPIQALANPFQFSKKDVNTAVTDDGMVWFCAKDVCEALDITWSGNTLRNMPENWKGMLKLNIPSGSQDAVFISEPGLYRLIFRSTKPEAVKFANWVCEEVLPAIRKQGFYGTIPSKDRLAYSKYIVSLVDGITSTKNKLRFETMARELRDMCNLVGHAVPDLSNVAAEVK
jgi:prophage antirepressor-like protein